jgi:signal transduction histidine kinase
MQNIVSLPSKDKWYAGAMEQLMATVQELSHAQALDDIMKIVRKTARELTNADGATFVLRDGDCCYYADENAISPLWKGQRFPMSRCVSGWVMKNAVPAVMEDIYADARVPAEAYRPTFVKSMLMVPIRQKNPVGAIGNYWARTHMPTPDEINILQALANMTAVAMENVNLHIELQKRISSLETSSMALGQFAWISAHDLKSPLVGINNVTQWIEESLRKKDIHDAQNHLKLLQERVGLMNKLLDDVLKYSQIEYLMDPYAEGDLVRGDDLVKDAVKLASPSPAFDVQINSHLKDMSLPRMPLQQIFYNLVRNAIAYNDKKDKGMVAIDAEETEDYYIFSVSDNGCGIPRGLQSKIFEIFQSQKSRDKQDEGGMGLPLVRKMLRVYGGDISVESIPSQGSIFRFTWPKKIKKA